MKRKVIQVAESTQLISLPREWSKANNVKKGDEVDVQSEGNRLIVTTNAANVTRRVTVDLTGMTKLRRPTLRGCYIKGYDEIEVIYSNPEYVQTIQQYVAELPGFDIVRQGTTSCTIKEISSPQPGEFENVLNRLFLLLSDTARTVSDALAGNDSQAIQSVQYREVSINKFANFCRRLINKQQVRDVTRAPTEYLIISLLELCGDEYKAIGTLLVDSSKSTAQLKETLQRCADQFAALYRLHSVYKNDAAIRNATEHDQLIVMVDKLSNVRGADVLVTHHVRSLVELLGDLREAILYKSV